MEALTSDLNITPSGGDVWATPPTRERNADAAPTKRQRAALAVVREVVGDTREQLEVMRRISVGLPVQVNERLADGTICAHYLRPTMADIRAACMFLIERRWGRARWAEAAPSEFGEQAQGLSLGTLPDGARLRLREVARELVLERQPAAALEKGHSPRDESDAASVLPSLEAVLSPELAPVWPAQGSGVEVPRPRGAWGRGGPGKGGPTRSHVGPLIEGRTLKMPEPLETSGIFPADKSSEVGALMPSPCSICGHLHEDECTEYMPGFGRSCRCPEYVDPDVESEDVVVVSPEQQRAADGAAVAQLAMAEPGSRCGCGHELGEHFATPASTRCTACGCRRYAEGGNERELAAHFAKVAKRGAS